MTTLRTDDSRWVAGLGGRVANCGYRPGPPRRGAQLESKVGNGESIVDGAPKPIILLLGLERSQLGVMAPGQFVPTSGQIESRGDVDQVPQGLAVKSGDPGSLHISFAPPRGPVPQPVAYPPVTDTAHFAEPETHGDPVGVLHVLGRCPRNGDPSAGPLRLDGRCSRFGRRWDDYSRHVSHLTHGITRIACRSVGCRSWRINKSLQPQRKFESPASHVILPSPTRTVNSALKIPSQPARFHREIRLIRRLGAAYSNPGRAGAAIAASAWPPRSRQAGQLSALADSGRQTAARSCRAERG
jgi:hypothetical protein